MGEFKLTRQSVLERSDHALRVGSLQPIPTESCFVEDGGVRFLVRIASNLARKQAVSTYEGPSRESEARPANPFLPYDEDLFVGKISNTHVAVLNKFQVVEHHLLIITRSFEDQESPLSRDDLEAMWICMAGYEALAFYNSGKTAGASQKHKHLQMVPLPMVPGSADCPIAPKIAVARFASGLGTVPGLPFPHVVARVGKGAVQQPSDTALETLETYRAMLDAVGVDPRRPAPYNLLVTRGWMFLVPRSRECFRAISVNALGFAGSFFVKTKSDLGLLREKGPMAALAAVAGPTSGS